MSRTIAIATAALLFVFAPGAQAQTAKWDQAAVTAAAAELESAVSGLRDAVRKSNAWNVTTDRSKLHEISQDLRQIEWLAASLHGDLEKGEGLEATTPVYEQILQRREYAKSDAMFVDINEFLKPKLAATRAALAKLSTYYVKQPSP
jgi:uncharacterized membrane protein